jgi:hypothetical protein
MDFLPITENEYNKKVNQEKEEAYISNICYLKEEDLEKPSIEDYHKVFRCLDANNYYTYMFHLQNDKKMSEEEKEFYKNIIKDLIQEERIKYLHMIEDAKKREQTSKPE